MEISGLISSAASGGLFGIIGSIGGRLMSIVELREKRKDTAAAYVHELDLIKLQQQARAEETEHELDIIAANVSRATVEGSWEGLKASIEAQTASQAATPWVRDTLALVRPVLTLVLLLAMVGSLWFLNNIGVAPTTYNELVYQLVNSIVFAAMTALLWWFGDRPATTANKPAK